MKPCISCYKVKDESEFIYPSSRHTFSSCKKCRTFIGKLYKNLSPDKFTFIKSCGSCNRYFPRTTEYFFKKLKNVSNDCKNCSIERNHSYYAENSKLILEQKQEYYIENKPRIEEYRQQYNKSDKARLYYKEVYKRRCANPIDYLKKNISTSILNCFKGTGNRKNKKTLEILGCSKEEFYEHLINTFEKNYDIPWKQDYIPLVAIDHILPISLCLTENDVLELNHYSNLQFLSRADNLEKSNNLDWKLDLTKTKLYDTIKELNLEQNNE